MPAINLDTADAIELAELPAFPAAWLAADPGTLSPSLLAYVGHPAYGLDTLRCHLDRFAFLLGGTDGGGHVRPVLTPGPPRSGQC